MIVFAYMISVFVVPVALGVSEAASCMDYSCTNALFSKCGGFSTQDNSSDFTGSWTKGMEGMMRMLGFDAGTPSNTSAGQITLNKV